MISTFLLLPANSAFTSSSKSLKLSLKDFLHSAPEDTGDLIYNLFVENFFKKVEQEHGIPFTEEDSQNLKKEISNVQFFVHDNGITLYFNPYQVAPYALGFPTVEIPYEQLPDSFFKANLSTAKCESLTFDLNANPTTGYSWKFDVSENISLKDEYIPEDMYSSCTAFNTNVGKGGIQRFTVTGLKEGNGTVCAYYYRPWEDKSTATRVKTYKFYVDENLLLTLIAEEDSEALGFLN